jgi:hypothetical protein
MSEVNSGVRVNSNVRGQLRGQGSTMYLLFKHHVEHALGNVTQGSCNYRSEVNSGFRGQLRGQGSNNVLTIQTPCRACPRNCRSPTTLQCAGVSACGRYWPLSSGLEIHGTQEVMTCYTTSDDMVHN